MQKLFNIKMVKLILPELYGHQKTQKTSFFSVGQVLLKLYQ